jgi:hypothetical protein
MLLQSSDPSGWLSFALGAGALLGGIGYAAGQFVSSRRRALSDSLNTALNELTAMKTRADRLDEEVQVLRAEVEQLRQANALLRQAIATGDHIAPAIEAAFKNIVTDVANVASKEHAETRKLIRELVEGRNT